MYGVALDTENAYVPVCDLYAQNPNRPGDLVAINGGQIGAYPAQRVDVCLNRGS